MEEQHPRLGGGSRIDRGPRFPVNEQRLCTGDGLFPNHRVIGSIRRQLFPQFGALVGRKGF
jgi:hypothetical protein